MLKAHKDEFDAGEVAKEVAEDGIVFDHNKQQSKGESMADSNVWDEIIYPSSYFNGTTDAVWEWITNFITPHEACDNLSNIGLKLTHIDNKAPRMICL